MALAPGDRVPSFAVLRKHGDAVQSDELWPGGPTVVLFYVFDFSGSDEGG
jgi:hypothetical protein